MDKNLNISGTKPENRNKIEIYAAVIIVVVTLGYSFFPLLWYGENAVVRANDCLDGDFVYRIVLAKSHTMFALNPMTPVNNIMNGLPRACLPTGLNLYQWIIFLFPDFTGFLINYLLIHLIGFACMFVFLRNHLLKLKEQAPLAMLIAVAFSILPVYAIGGISVLGIPLVANSLLFIQQGKGKPKHYLGLMLYAFYSFYPMFTMTIIGACLFFAWDVLRHKRFNRKLFLGVAFLCICVLIAEYQLVYVMLFHKITPHRLVEHFVTTLNYKGVFVETMITACNGIMSSANYPNYLLGLSTMLIVIFYFIYKPDISIQLKLLLLILLVSLGVAIWDWYQLQPLYNRFSFFSMFSFKRMNFYLPFLVYVLLASALSLSESKWRWMKYLVIAAVLFSTLKIDYDFDHSNGSDRGKLTYHQFYSEKLFKEVNAYIGKPQDSYRVCDVGLLPAVAQYNGFFTLDGYQYLFPMEYRNQFVKIVQGELDKNRRLAGFFVSPSGSPNVCFTLSSEQYNALADGTKIDTIHNFDLNYDALKSLDCQYILSIYPVEKFTSDKIVFQKEFINTEAPFNVYLYKVI